MLISAMRAFLSQLDARLEQDGFHSGAQKAAALGVHPATWSRTTRGLARFSAPILEAGLSRYPDLAIHLVARPSPVVEARYREAVA